MQLTDSDCIANTDVHNMNLIYRVPDPRVVFGEWDGCKKPNFNPNARQAVVIQAVSEALARGLYYTDEVLAACRITLNVSPEDAAKRKASVEGGTLGMECYYARCFIGALEAQRESQEALDRMQAAPGMELGTLVFNDFKRVYKAVVAEVDGTDVTITGKRGNQSIRFACEASSLRHAINRAAEHRLRTTNFDMAFPAVQRPEPEAKLSAPESRTGNDDQVDLFASLLCP